MFLWKEGIPHCFVLRVFWPVQLLFHLLLSELHPILNASLVQSESLQLESITEQLCKMVAFWGNPFFSFFSLHLFSPLFSTSLPPSPGHFPPYSSSLLVFWLFPSLTLSVLLCSLSVHFFRTTHWRCISSRPGETSGCPTLRSPSTWP